MVHDHLRDETTILDRPCSSSMFNGSSTSRVSFQGSNCPSVMKGPLAKCQFFGSPTDEMKPGEYDCAVHAIQDAWLILAGLLIPMVSISLEIEPGPNTFHQQLNKTISFQDPIEHGHWMFAMSVANLISHHGPGGSSIFFKSCQACANH